MSGGPQRAIALPHEVESLLDELDSRAQASGEGAKYAQRTPRLRYRHANVPFQWRRSDGLVIQSTIHTRNLSVGGLGGLHSGELPRNVPVTMTLTQLDGVAANVTGYLVYSQGCKDDWWSVGVKFDQAIKLKSFVRDSA